MRQAETASERPFALRTPYTEPQPEGPLSVREYLLCEQEGARVCLVRFVKNEDIPIDAITLTLTMLDAGGMSLGETDVTFRDSDLPRAAVGEELTPMGAIPVDERCVELGITIREVASEHYRYRLEGERVRLDYCPPMPWPYDPYAGESARLSDEVPLCVRSKRAGKVRFLWPIGALGMLLLLAYMLLPLLEYLR